MDVTITEASADGRVCIENEGWSVPSLQERRAILYAAQREIDELQALVEALQNEHKG